MTDWSVIFINGRNVVIAAMSLKLSPSSMNVLLTALLIATAGGILQIGGASWDITSHIMRKPETFFTPSHAVLYAGAGLTVIAATIGLFVSLKNRKEIRGRPFHIAFKLLTVGAAIQLVSGPGDFMWHSVFGVDGLMSPPHLSLATGILISTVAVVVGLARILPYVESKRNQRLAKTALVPAFAALWFSSIWYIFFFVLPLSNGQHFTFNPNPAAAIVIATTALPFVSAMIFLVSARTISRLGAATAVAGIVISMNVLANIVPAYQFLGSFIPWQLLAVIPAVVGADIAIHKLRARSTGMMVAGALIGVTFYVFNYPMLPMAFAVVLNQPNASIADILPSMNVTLSQVIGMTAVPSALEGIVGAIAGSKITRRMPPQAHVVIDHHTR
jgi:hypothetical protein